MVTKTVIDFQPLFDKIQAYTDRYESGIEITDWKSQQITKVLLDGVLLDVVFETLDDMAKMFIAEGYGRNNAMVVSFDLMRFLCEDLFKCHSPRDVYETFRDDKVRYIDADRCLMITRNGSRDVKSTSIRITATELRQLS